MNTGQFFPKYLLIIVKKQKTKNKHPEVPIFPMKHIGQSPFGGREAF